MGDVMEAADPADVSNAVEAAVAVANAVDGAAMKAMPAAVSAAVASAVAAAMTAAMTSAASRRDVWRERRGNDRRRDGNSNGRFSQHGSVPP
jgi:hypothetical protein